ncbi:putative membrane protein [Rhodotorula toruloides]|uniref:Efficient mitochondria targeting-associated protein 19 n=1 Tax=Rhodotorula toruloides TaxID=5286 RepID=A0A0K3CDG5_RHOTO|nr:putative membrane protein [Rhodotorula toruloides]PRQ76772.1 Transmembrane protein 6/97 [Rhodotorula toruloides]
MLSQRTRDWVYFGFFAVHLPATLLVDIQALFCAEALSPTWLRTPFLFASKDDPLLQNANSPLFAWFQSFIILEILLQVPVFVVGMRGLWKNTPTIYPLLLLYSSSSATTTLACLATVLSLPSLPPAHLTKLLASYTPFFLVPAGMAVDMLGRLAGLVRRAEKGKGKAD